MKKRIPPAVLCLLLLAASALGAAAAPGFQVSYGLATATSTPLADGGKVNLGAANTTGSQVVFWIKNTGTTDLTGVTVTPASPADYFLTSVLFSSPFSPGKYASFTATLNVGPNTSHKQVISITAAGLTANPFDIELNAPEIVVEQPEWHWLVSDQTVAFGKLDAASHDTLTFTVMNIGSYTLGNLQLGYYNNPGYNYADYTYTGLDGHKKSLAPNTRLKFNLKLKPGADTNHDAKFYIPSDDWDEAPFKIHVTAPEITVEHIPGTRLVDGTAVLDFGGPVGPTPNLATITVKNTGSADLNGLDVSISGEGAGDYTLVAMPVTTLAPNASTSFTVSFDPATTQGSHLASLEIVSTDADETQFNIALKAPEIAVETSGRELSNNGDYGFDTEEGASRTTVFTVRNKGSSTLTNLALFPGGPAAAEYTVFPLKATTLAPNATTTFNVKFTPAGPGPRVAFLQITSNDGDENPFNIIFREPRIQVTAAGGVLVNGKSTVDFGSLASPSNTVTVTVTNQGGANLELEGLAPTLSGVDAADFTVSPWLTNTLAPLASTTFDITLDAASQKTHAATLDILSNHDSQSPFRFFVKAPEIGVEQPAGTNLTNGSSTAEFGTVSTASSSTFTFTVKNQGSSPLGSLVATIDGTNPADFTVTGPAATTLAPKGKTTLTVRFAPLGTGPRAGVLVIANNDVDEEPFAIPLNGFGMAVTLHPAPQLVGVGESATFMAGGITAGPPVFTWLKDGKPIPGPDAHAAIYTIPVVALGHAGSYSCLIVDGKVTVSSGKARLGVVGSAAIPVTVNEGTTIALKLAESIPPGPPATHQWRKDGGPLGNSGAAPNRVISGAATAALSITKSAEGDDGSYTCLVGMDGLTKESGPFNVSVRLKPVINAAGPFDWLVSGTVTDQITAANDATSFKFGGLPAGVTGNTTTGQLSGKPGKPTAGPMSFTVSATNPAGTGPARTVGYTVAALPAAAVGTFNGLIDRSVALSAPVAGQLTKGHGGSLSNLVITSSGSFTGKVSLEDKTDSLPAGGRLDAIAGGNPTATVVIVRGKAGDAIPDLTLEFEIDKATGELTGGLSDGVIATPVPVSAWRNPWVVSTKPAQNNPATAFAGAYTAAMVLDPALAGTEPPKEANVDYPQGTGFMSLAVTAAGVVSGTGVLGDGMGVTLSTTLGPDGEIPLHFMLYTPTAAATAGSLHGWTRITGTNWDSVPPFDWGKLPQPAKSTARGYKDGFPLHNLTLTGGLYTKPAPGVIVLGLAGPPANARLVFSEGGIKDSNLGAGGPLVQNFGISTANSATLPTGLTDNPGAVKISTFKADTGALGGSFTLIDDDPRTTVSATATVTRTVPWTGVLVPRLGRGVGQFQLPNLPASTPPATTPTNSPTLSGKVELLANP